MIVVRITMNVMPEKQKEVVQTLLSMTGPMEKALGCLSYSLLCDIKDHNLLSVFEAWESREKLEHHLNGRRGMERRHYVKDFGIQEYRTIDG